MTEAATPEDTATAETDQEVARHGLVGRLLAMLDYVLDKDASDELKLEITISGANWEEDEDGDYPPQLTDACPLVIEESATDAELCSDSFEKWELEEIRCLLSSHQKTAQTLKTTGQEVNTLNERGTHYPGDRNAEDSDADKIAAWDFQAAHLVTGNESQDGSWMPDYWRVFASRKSGSKIISGYGNSADEAMADAHFNVLKEIETPCSGSEPPPKKKGWNHSQQVLAYYEGNEQNSTTYGIAYYHYDPPFEKKPKWINFSGHGGNRRPTCWWPLPTPPNA